MYLLYKYTGAKTSMELVGTSTTVMTVDTGENVHDYYPH